MTLTEAIRSKGVSHALAQHRASQISNVAYRLRLNVSEEIAVPVTGTATISFDRNGDGDLLLDYAAEADGTSIDAIVNGAALTLTVENQHILLPEAALRKGENRVEIPFKASDVAVHRGVDHLYSLFVPANARYAFPCFDQPDIKASFSVDGTVPEGWRQLSNVAPGETIDHLPTYLCCFAAGKFREVESNGITVYLLQSDGIDDKHLCAVTDLIARSIAYMESYTGLSKPFPRYGILLLPEMRFGGMEHPGLIYLRESRAVVNEGDGRVQRFPAENTLMHETAHLWVGDVVTMRWFDEVWIKEGLANFFADKIGISLGLRTKAQSYKVRVDQMIAYRQTDPDTPIARQLDNLTDAMSMYGKLSYQKAALAFHRLEDLMGEAPFRAALQEMLSTYRYSNCSWGDMKLIMKRYAPSGTIDTFDRDWIQSPHLPEKEISYLHNVIN